MTLLLCGASFAGRPAHAQGASNLGLPLPQTAYSRLETGSPEVAFAGGPIRLSLMAGRILSARWPGDKVPIVPEPFRGQLDTALVAHDWPRLLVRKADLGASRGQIALLLWEQSRLLATGSLWLAELNARDLAASGLPGTPEAAALAWLYAAAVTMTDGQHCAAPDARDTHLAALRGPAFAPVLTVLRTLPENQLAQARDAAIKLEAALAPQRDEDTACRTGAAVPALRPDDAWRADAARTREILLRHLNAICALVRGRPSPPPPGAAAQASQGGPGAPRR